MPEAPAIERLRGAASDAGVDPGRVVFAPPLPLPEHLARLRQADLFLDTFHCGGHTTASDALWAGVPVITRRGDTFASRVAASLLRAVDLPELVTDSTDEYQALVVALASDRGRLAALRDKLADRRLRAPLFDTPRYARGLEAAYTTMLA
jgi:predicted O-linked N-acetylglucosamine transferase (SPINDLY family)